MTNRPIGFAAGVAGWCRGVARCGVRVSWPGGLLGAAAGALGFLAPAVHAETLEEAMATAYMTNPQLLAERANLRTTDEGVSQGLAGYRPNIQLQAEGGRQTIVTSGAAEDTFFPPVAKRTLDNDGTLDANLTENLYNGGGTVAATAEAEDKVIAERANLIATEETVLYNVITAYYDVLRDQALVNYDHQYEDELGKILEGTRAMARVRVLTEVDLAQAEGRHQAAIAQTNTDEANLEADRGEYEAAVGHLPDVLVEPTLKPQIPLSLNDAISLAAKNNPKLISLIYTERSSRDQVAVEEAQLLPSIDLVLDRSLNANTSFAGVTANSASAMVRLTVPFYNQGLAWSQSRAAIEATGTAQGNTDEQRRVAAQSARAAWEAATTGRSSIAALTASVAADERAVSGSQQQLRVGVISVLDMVLIEQYLYQDETNLARATHDQHLAEFNLMMQIGNLTASDVALNVNLYDPNKHYNSVRNKLFGLDSAKK